MQHFNKDQLLTAAKDHIGGIRKKITTLIPEYKRQIQKSTAALPKLSSEDKFVTEGVIRSLAKQSENLEALYPSPYFIKCIVKFDTDPADRIFYFSKFSLPDESIYSWTTPAASLRFSDIGPFSYRGGDNALMTGMLSHKEQYLISDGRIVFLAAENKEFGRELIYQEHFSSRKTEFSLPEIVEQMEAAQDKAIRTSPTRSLLISGPAGSGKTTLALHRVAYLLQSPDTAERFTPEKTIVFVNDHGTKKYFSRLLPELGITNVTITTFADFVFEHLHIYGYSYEPAFGETEQEKNIYAFEKHHILQQEITEKYNGSVNSALERIYGGKLSTSGTRLFEKQIKNRVLDRFDITAIFDAYLKTHGGLSTIQTEFEQLRGGKVKRTERKIKKEYSLIVLDEVQNYLPTQLSLITRCLSLGGSCVYVGDLAQQTRLFTIRSWEQINEEFTNENTVHLEKVYRSTKQILEYVRAQGYEIPVSESARPGDAVKIIHIDERDSLEATTKAIINTHANVTIGVLSMDQGLVNKLVHLSTPDSRVKVLAVSEAQGVEFDVVLLCTSQGEDAVYPQELLPQIEQVRKDLFYVALTRAMNKLYILKIV